MDDRIRELIDKNARLAVSAASLADDADLYAAGMSSQASVNLMLALEDAFDLEFPDSMLTREVFSSVSAIRAALVKVGDAAVS
jgi:acyl carrier protein